jgi:hypothetical protein
MGGGFRAKNLPFIWQLGEIRCGFFSRKIKSTKVVKYGEVILK